MRECQRRPTIWQKRPCAQTKEKDCAQAYLSVEQSMHTRSLRRLASGSSSSIRRLLHAEHTTYAQCAAETRPRQMRACVLACMRQSCMRTQTRCRFHTHTRTHRETHTHTYPSALAAVVPTVHHGEHPFAPGHLALLCLLVGLPAPARHSDICSLVDRTSNRRAAGALLRSRVVLRVLLGLAELVRQVVP